MSSKRLRPLLNMLLSIVSTLSFANFAFGHSCEENLISASVRAVSANEAKMSAILKQMNDLKGEETTREVLAELEKLNQQALTLISEELIRQNVQFRIVDPSKDPNSVFAKDKQKKPEEFKTLAPMRQKPMLGALHMMAKPYILIEESPRNPPLINTLIRKYNVEIILSPNFKSLNLETLAAVNPGDQPKFYYPIEEVFGPNFGSNGTILHEVHHLHHARKVAKGINLPYYIDVHANKDEKLHYEKEDFYDRFMSFDELSAWSRDLSYTQTELLGPLRKRSFKEGHVYEHGTLEAIRFRGATGLKILIHTAEKVLLAIRTQIATNPQALNFKVKRSGHPHQSIVTTAYEEKGKPVGIIKVVLVNLNSENEAQRMAILEQYLDQVEDRLRFHKSQADTVLAEFGDKSPGEAWIRIW